MLARFQIRGKPGTHETALAGRFVVARAAVDLHGLRHSFVRLLPTFDKDATPSRRFSFFPKLPSSPLFERITNSEQQSQA